MFGGRCWPPEGVDVDVLVLALAHVPDVVVACVRVALGSIIVIIIRSIAAVVMIRLLHGLLSGAPGIDAVGVVIVASIL